MIISCGNAHMHGVPYPSVLLFDVFRSRLFKSIPQFFLRLYFSLFSTHMLNIYFVFMLCIEEKYLYCFHTICYLETRFIWSDLRACLFLGCSVFPYFYSRFSTRVYFAKSINDPIVGFFFFLHCSPCTRYLICAQLSKKEFSGPLRPSFLLYFSLAVWLPPPCIFLPVSVLSCAITLKSLDFSDIKRPRSFVILWFFYFIFSLDRVALALLNRNETACA